MATPAAKPYQKMPDLVTLVADLVQAQLLSQVDANKVLAGKRSASQVNRHPLEYLASLKLQNDSEPGQPLTLDTLSHWLADKVGQPFFSIDPLKIDAKAITSVMSHAYAKRHNILAVEVHQEYVVIASAQPWDAEWEENLRHINRKDIRRVVASPADIQRYTQELYKLSQSVEGALGGKSSVSGVGNFEQLLELGNLKSLDANDQHIVNIVDWLLQYAFEQRASDIHIEPRRERCHLRFRIDGVLHLIYELPLTVTAAVISRIKIMGRMNVAEKRKPQDGRLKTRTPDGYETELRLATLPTAFGEKLVMRIFDPDVIVKGLSDLGFSDEDEQRWRAMSGAPHGIVLVTGPTGSGKTTTLYSTLKTLATPQVNVCTIEDPIEMIEPAFNQMQVQPAIDLNFAAGLRALLRQDPDIIMVGEIRDAETADMAMQAALTGHLVLSTMHTNDAPSAITRMMELGIPAYLIKSSVLGVMAQRLVRTLCPDCKQPMSLDNDDWNSLIKPWSAEAPGQIFEAKGCPNCRDTGYRGRTGLYEIMLLDGDLPDMLNDKTDAISIRQQALKQGMHSLRLSGAEKIAAGLTTIEEVLRVTPDHLYS